MNKSYLYYITLNGYLRAIELTKIEVNTGTSVITNYYCTIQEKYLVTGLYLDGQIVPPTQVGRLIESGLKPIEPFLFVASNKMFQIHESEYRLENTEFILKFVEEK